MLAPRIAEAPLQVRKSAVALVFCNHAGVSYLLAHNGLEGAFFPVKTLSEIQRMGRDCRSRGNGGTVLRVTNDWHIQGMGWVGTGSTRQSGPSKKGVRLHQIRHHRGRYGGRGVRQKQANRLS